MASIEKLKGEVLSFLDVPLEKININLHESLLESGLLDSMNVLELITHLEQAYKVEFTTEDMTRSNFETINAIGKLLTRKNISIEHDNTDNS
ncbi:MAG: acyl carrier protein [Candidatus Scalinduaceae bacterium]